MLIIPAIDLREGKCVRLYQGNPEEETVFSEDPVDVAKSWQSMGASWLHLVDLDGAFTGTPKNLEIVKQILHEIDIPVQMGGGIRSLEVVEHVLAAGVERVIIGTVAISHPELVAKACERFGERVAVGIDSKYGQVAVEGWEATVEKSALDLAVEMKKAGVTRVIHTDTSRDGTMEGPNLESTKEMAEKSGLKIIASGGMSSLEDIKAVKAIETYGVEGVILGRSIYTGSILLSEAIDLINEAMEA